MDYLDNNFATKNPGASGWGFRSNQAGAKQALADALKSHDPPRMVQDAYVTPTGEVLTGGPGDAVAFIDERAARRKGGRGGGGGNTLYFYCNSEQVGFATVNYLIQKGVLS
jgi:hypothetical protein